MVVSAIEDSSGFRKTKTVTKRKFLDFYFYALIEIALSEWKRGFLYSKKRERTVDLIEVIARFNNAEHVYQSHPIRRFKTRFFEKETNKADRYFLLRR